MIRQSWVELIVGLCLSSDGFLTLISNPSPPPLGNQHPKLNFESKEWTRKTTTKLFLAKFDLLISFLFFKWDAWVTCERTTILNCNFGKWSLNLSKFMKKLRVLKSLTSGEGEKHSRVAFLLGHKRFSYPAAAIKGHSTYPLPCLSLFAFSR